MAQYTFNPIMGLTWGATQPALTNNFESNYYGPINAAGHAVNCLGVQNAGPLYEIRTRGMQDSNFLCWRDTSWSNHPDTGEPFDPNNPTFTNNPEDEAEYRFHYKYDYRWPPELDKEKEVLKDENETRTRLGENEQMWNNLTVGEWQGRYNLRLAQLAVQHNRRIMHLSVSSGDHDLEFWNNPSMIEFIKFAIAHPYNTIISLHEYSYVKENLFALAREGGDNATLQDLLNAPNEQKKVGRFKLLFDFCDALKLGGYPMIYHAEWGWDKRGIPASKDKTIEQIDQWFRHIVGPYMPWIYGEGLWYSDDWEDERDLARQVEAMIPIFKDYAINTQITVDIHEPIDGGEPVPPEETLQQHLRRVAKEAQTVSYNRDAALQKAGNQDGYGITGSETRTTYNDKSYAVQPFGALDEDTERFYYAEVGDWGNVKHGDLREDSPTPPNNWHVLNIPHQDQNGADAQARSNDCGAACASMVINGMTSHTPTTDEIAIAYQHPPHNYMSFSDIDNALNGHDMNGKHKRPYHANQMSDTIMTKNEPVIALVWYQSLPQKYSSFNGSHFIVLYGTDGNEILYHDPLNPNGDAMQDKITFAQLDKACADVTAEGNQANQAMDCEIKDTPPNPEPPPVGELIDTHDYFIPSGQYGIYLVMDAGSSTQPMQLEKRANDVILRKGDGNWIDGKKYQDSEQWRVTHDAVLKGVDTSDAGNGGRDAYDLDWAQWIPRHVHVGKTYHSTPTVRRFNRINCQTISTSQANDYLHIKEVVKDWVSPRNSSIVLHDVLVIEWRSGTNDLSVAPTETYYFCKNFGYVGWGDHFVSELPQGRAPLNGELDCGL